MINKTSTYKHGFHLVDPSPWPLVGALGLHKTTFGCVFVKTNYRFFSKEALKTNSKYLYEEQWRVIFSDFKNKSFVEMFNFASDFIEKNAKIEPTTSEYRLQLIAGCFIIFLSLGRILWEMYLISLGDMTPVQLSSTFLYIRSCAYFFMFFVSIQYLYRVLFPSLGTCFWFFKLFFKYTYTNMIGSTTLFFAGLGATFWKMKKPIAAACMFCIGGLSGINDQFYATYGFSISREIELARHGFQPWSETRRHILNPSDYMRSSLDPQLQDELERAKQLVEENIRQRNEILNQQNEILNQRNEILNQRNEIDRLNKIIEDSIKKK